MSVFIFFCIFNYYKTFNNFDYKSTVSIDTLFMCNNYHIFLFCIIRLFMHLYMIYLVYIRPLYVCMHTHTYIHIYIQYIYNIVIHDY